MRAATLLDIVLRLYPPWWRAQYGEEVRGVSRDLLADGRSVGRVMLNLFIGAVRARVSAAGAPRQYEVWADRTRASLVVAPFPLLLVIPVILSFRQGQRDAYPPARLGTLSLGPSSISAAGHVVYDAFGVMAFTLVIGISTLFWGYAHLAGAVRRQGRNGRRLRRMARLPGIAAGLVVVLWVGGIVVAPHDFVIRHGVAHPLNGHYALSRGLYGAAAALLLVGLLAAVITVVMEARQGHLSLADLASGKWVGVTTSGVLCVVASAAVISLVALWRQGSPEHATYSIVTTSWGSWWIAGVVLLLGAALVSTWGTVQTARALRITAQLAA